MEIKYVSEVEAETAFVKEAAEYFKKHPTKTTYSTAEIEPGCFFAVRWGIEGQAVLVLRLDESKTPTVYGDLLPELPHETKV